MAGYCTLSHGIIYMHVYIHHVRVLVIHVWARPTLHVQMIPWNMGICSDSDNWLQ